MHLVLAALLLAATASDPGEQPPRCEDMRRLSDAANRAGSFRALIDAGFAPPILYGCRPADGGYRCWRNVTPPEVTPERYGAIIRDCLPGATMAAVEARDGFRPDTARVVRHGRLVARLDDSCTSACRAGRGMSIAFTIDPAAPAAEQAEAR